MTHKLYTPPIANGTLIQIKIGDKASSKATSFMTFKDTPIANNEIGMIVDAKIWPDQNWPRRNHFQEHAPYYKILFGHDIVLISERNIPSTIIQIIQLGNE